VHVGCLVVDVADLCLCILSCSLDAPLCKSALLLIRWFGDVFASAID
jgi:hypothetical protein